MPPLKYPCMYCGKLLSVYHYQDPFSSYIKLKVHYCVHHIRDVGFWKKPGY